MFKESVKNYEKNQIILCHTGREVKHFLTSLSLRYGSTYSKIPHYVVSRNGEITKLLSDAEICGIKINSKSLPNAIFIMLENLGWLEKKQLSNSYVNWIGDIYNGNIIEKKWRDYIFWDPYSNKQIESLAMLLKNLFRDNQIENKIVEHNTKILNSENFEGVLCRSNFDFKYTDLSPAFDFKILEKKLYNE